MQRTKPTRFEVELRTIHGDDFDFVEVEPRVYSAPSSPTQVARFKAWWKRQSKMEKVWLGWFWSLMFIVGSILGVAVAAILTANG